MTGNDNGKIINKAVVCVTVPHFQGSMILLSFGLLGCAFGNTICHPKKGRWGAKLNETLCIVTKFRELLENYFLTFVIPMCDNESPSESNHDKLCLWRAIYDDFLTSRGN